MTDERKRPPPRFPRPPSPDDEIAYVPPDTERSGAKPMPQAEPFKLLTAPKWAVALEKKFDDVYKRQKQMALQLDGYGSQMHERFDVFHKELAMLRAVVTGDHAPRITKVETTLGHKVAKGGGIVGIILVALPLLSEVLPKWASLFEQIGAFLQ